MVYYVLSKMRNLAFHNNGTLTYTSVYKKRKLHAP